MKSFLYSAATYSHYFPAAESRADIIACIIKIIIFVELDSIMVNWKSLLLPLALLFMPVIPVAGQEPDTVNVVSISFSYEEGFNNIVALMEQYEGRGNVSLMKLGKLAMTMGKTVGRAGSEWTRKVAKAFKRVNTVYMLEYSEAGPGLREEIETAVNEYIIKANLILSNKAGNQVFDETFGQVSDDGKHVSDLIIIMYDQSVVCIKGTVLASDVERIVRRLNKQL